MSVVTTHDVSPSLSKCMRNILTKEKKWALWKASSNVDVHVCTRLWVCPASEAVTYHPYKYFLTTARKGSTANRDTEHQCVCFFAHFPHAHLLLIFTGLGGGVENGPRKNPLNFLGADLLNKAKTTFLPVALAEIAVFIQPSICMINAIQIATIEK